MKKLNILLSILVIANLVVRAQMVTLDASMVIEELFSVDGDIYRDPLTGEIKNSSENQTYSGTFTPHSSPLALVFDTEMILPDKFQRKLDLVKSDTRIYNEL